MPRRSLFIRTGTKNAPSTANGGLRRRTVAKIRVMYRLSRLSKASSTGLCHLYVPLCWQRNNFELAHHYANEGLFHCATCLYLTCIPFGLFPDLVQCPEVWCPHVTVFWEDLARISERRQMLLPARRGTANQNEDVIWRVDTGYGR